MSTPVYGPGIAIAGRITPEYAQILTPEARDRLATVKMAYPDVARAVEDQLIRLVQAGQINRQIDEPTLKQILRKVAPQKRDITIERV